ncbi:MULTISPECIES: peptide chain release factor 1 [Megasphaera]|jgi:peptide chain release factor 1|uniref:Peptide chain release factor 1 n=3 Tax=Megasphaera TaxID=906 RepID=A0ABV1CVL8_9FIRM|nr:peptide chain release factor 1 [Megasphaera sp.]MBD9021399.1 peptide chain release factor 1 [Megasphaera elsdenii]MCH3903462.1 peptide chain release factor 1 [Limosilactobacillus oris]MCI1887566.1 peptide chain release factor 1 [Sporolactobacillus sp.]MCI1905493.1 peptide chain release factor 1 [Enterococcaceae bacterium]MBS7221914.1 peptide chain release factor 1 [Megasphaera sp.]
MSSFMDKVQAVENKFMDLEQQISDPSVIARQDEWQKLTKEHASLMPIVETFRKYKDITSTIDGDKEIIDDPDSDDDLIAMAKEEMNGLTKEQADLEDQLHVLMLPKDPRDDKNVIMEIRAGAGGDEAALFAGDLFRMYMKYIEKQPGWKTSIISSNAPELGGFKEVVFSVEGSGVYGKLKYESGVHRVQRVPVTEAGGRIHTSTATVAVLPEAEDVEIDLNMDDVRVDYFRASGAGGQHVNKTSSAVRMTHIPTGMVVECQDERSQLENRAKALRVLKARLLDQAQQKADAELTEERRSQVGTGDRSERIRTYNFPQGRVTDHRINLTLYKLDNILNGDIDEFIQALAEARRAELMKEAEDE